MQIKTIYLLLILTSTSLLSQTNNHNNLYKKWFCGVELGLNEISSYIYNEPTLSFQGGIMAEYFYVKKWSFTARIKYLKIGESRGIAYISINNNPARVDLKYYKRFDGETISLFLNSKKEYNIVNNFKGFLKFGVVFNQEVVSKYNRYPEGKKVNYPTFFVDYNVGLGFIRYFTAKKLTAFYIEFEFKGLGRDRHNAPIFILPQSANNSLINFGLKFELNKEK